MLEADGIRQVIDSAKQPMRTMILLGINAGLGQSDIANIPQSAVDLDKGWIDYPRPKTGIERTIPLWKETVDALRDVITKRPHPKDEDDSNLYFVTKYGNRFVRTSERGAQIDGVALQFAKLLRNLNLKRPGLNFYALRHTFQTIAEAGHDFPAIRHVMTPTLNEVPSGQWAAVISFPAMSERTGCCGPHLILGLDQVPCTANRKAFDSLCVTVQNTTR